MHETDGEQLAGAKGPGPYRSLQTWTIAACERDGLEFLKFCGVGLSGIGVNLGLYFVLTRAASLSMSLSSPVAIEASILWNFLLNDLWTFGGRRVQASFVARLTRFHAVCGLGGVVNYAILLLLVRSFHWWDIYANLCGIALGVAVKYAFNSAWTWREHPSTPPVVEADEM